MWQANKIVIIFNIICIIALAISYQQIVGSDSKLADKVLLTGICAMLFIGGLISVFLSKKRSDTASNHDSDSHDHSDSDHDSDCSSDSGSDND